MLFRQEKLGVFENAHATMQHTMEVKVGQVKGIEVIEHITDIVTTLELIEQQMLKPKRQPS